MTIALPLFICILGAILWVICEPKYPKLSQAGYVMFCCGLLVTLFNRAEIIAVLLK